MGAVVAIFGIVVVLALVGGAFESKEWRPFIGLLAISLVVVVMGWVVGFVSEEAGQLCFVVAKWVAIVAALLVCLKVIVLIATKMAGR
jgi:hypothetical protein